MQMGRLSSGSYFWLMMVSIATVVFPVERSPMMSSRWPRPIGIIASIALMPVWSGTETDFRSMTPDDSRSTGIMVTFLKGPLPSTGSPRAFTTRPRSSSLDGTESILPVDLTVMPSFTRDVSPRMTVRTPSSSRLRMRPKRTPEGSIESLRDFPACSSNSRTSDITALPRPSMAQTPSPTAVTRPTCELSPFGEKCSISFTIFSIADVSILFCCGIINRKQLCLPTRISERPLFLQFPSTDKCFVDRDISVLSARSFARRMLILLAGDDEERTIRVGISLRDTTERVGDLRHEPGTPFGFKRLMYARDRIFRSLSFLDHMQYRVRVGFRLHGYADFFSRIFSAASMAARAISFSPADRAWRRASSARAV